ncbi:TVP38/TMEM64 family protein [Clostridium sp.]|uniref:TVP38/TMEM64 family protein n=1 Tax=Clostridium sp. TaxID=1506 RepID=UPI0034640D07
MGISSLIAILGVLPSVFITGANLIFFGPYYGFLISLMGEVIGAGISFYIYRKTFKNKVHTIKGKYKIIDRILEAKGNKAGILILEGRLIPFVPSGVVTLASSISSINIAPFLIATFIGKAPSILLELLISYDLINSNLPRLIITLIGLMLLGITIKRGKGSD